MPIPVGATLPLPQYATKLADPLTALKKARDNAAVAVQQGVMRTRMKALHEVEAAMVTINKEFGIPSLHLNLAHNDMGARVSLEVWVRHIDCFYPLLRAGHVQEAKAKAEKSSANYPSPEKS